MPDPKGVVMTIAEFIEARLAEDQQMARAADKYWRGDFVDGADTFGTLGSAVYEHADRHEPARVLRQVAALQAVVGRRAGEHREREPYGICEICRGYDGHREYGPVPWPCPTVRAVASIWLDHFDYQEEWAT